MAFASASGLSPAVGITTAFWVSLFAFLSDSHYAIITTSLGMALMAKTLITEFGYEGFQVSMFISGVILLFLLLTRLYKYMVIIPKCVMDGFLMGCVISLFAEHLYAIFNLKIEESKGGLLMKLVHGLGQVFA